MKSLYLSCFFNFTAKNNRNQLEKVVKAFYGLHPNKYFEILNLAFEGRSLVMRCFRLHQKSRGTDEITDLPISIDFCSRNAELLLLFSTISPWLYEPSLNTLLFLYGKIVTEINFTIIFSH